MTKKEIIKNLKNGANTKLDKKVLSIILSHEENYRNIKDIKERFNVLFSDLMHGCQTGIISELIYYKDTKKFFDNTKKDIIYLINSLINDGLFKKTYNYENGFDYININNEYIKINNEGINQLKFNIYQKNALVWCAVDYSISYFYSIFENIKEV